MPGSAEETERQLHAKTDPKTLFITQIHVYFQIDGAIDHGS